MELTHICDYYYLNAILHTASENDSASRMRNLEKAQELMDELVPKLAESMMSYLFLASMGEARHAATGITQKLFSPDLTGTGGLSRETVYQKAVEYDPKACAPKLLKLFEQHWNGSSYGGDKWADIVKGLVLFFTKPDAFFIDHAVDLQHNGGTAFNKTEAYHVVKFSCSFAGGGMYAFLNYKANKDILKKEPPGRIYVTGKVLSLIKRFVSDEYMESGKIAELPATKGWDWEPVKWGKKVIELEEKVVDYRNVCDYGNQLSLEEIYELLPHIIYPKKLLAIYVTPKTIDKVMLALKKEHAAQLKEAQSIWDSKWGKPTGFQAYKKAETFALNTALKYLKKEVMQGSSVKLKSVIEDVSA